MFRSSRRFWPLYLALGCWLLLIGVPATRSGVQNAWSNRFSGTQEDAVTIASSTGHSNDDELLRRFPSDKRVEIYAAEEGRGAAKLLSRYPHDVAVIALALRQQIGALNSDRNEGPLTNPNFPASPPNVTKSSSAVGAPAAGMEGSRVPSRAEWNRFLALTRRAQQMEPNNSYFSWMRLYGLFATRQDALARLELARAARCTAYDDHAREIALNHLSVLRLTYGSPLSPRDQNGVWNTLLFPELSRFRQTCRWIMEGVIADRQNGRHARALNSAFHLVKMGRVMRRESYTIINSLVGTACEAIAIGSVTMPPRTRGISKPRPGSSLGSFHADPRMLYSYAKHQKRGDIMRYLNGEWVEMGKWQTGLSSFIGQTSLGAEAQQALILLAAERFALLCVKALPSMLFLGVLFTLLARRFPDNSGARGLLWQGAWFGAALLVLAMVCDAIIVWRVSNSNTSGFGLIDWTYMGGGLTAELSWWVYGGMTIATVCLGLNRAVAWQRKQHLQPIPWLLRVKTIFQAPEDGLTRFDFGWILGLAAGITGWTLLLGGVLAFCYNLQEIRSALEGSVDVSVLSLGGAALVIMGLSASVWRSLPRRRQTLRLSLRFIAGALGGAFVATSVLYALVTLSVLPLALKNERKFETSMQRGELAMARAKMGL